LRIRKVSDFLLSFTTSMELELIFLSERGGGLWYDWVVILLRLVLFLVGPSKRFSGPSGMVEGYLDVKLDKAETKESSEAERTGGVMREPPGGGGGGGYMGGRAPEEGRGGRGWKEVDGGSGGGGYIGGTDPKEHTLLEGIAGIELDKETP